MALRGCAFEQSQLLDEHHRGSLVAACRRNVEIGAQRVGQIAPLGLAQRVRGLIAPARGAQLVGLRQHSLDARDERLGLRRQRVHAASYRAIATMLQPVATPRPQGAAVAAWACWA